MGASRGVNWAVGGRPVSRRRGAYIGGWWRKRRQEVSEKENRHGNDCDQRAAERLARRSGAGPDRRGGLRAGRLVRPGRGQGPRRVEQGRARRGATRRG